MSTPHSLDVPASCGETSGEPPGGDEDAGSDVSRPVHAEVEPRHCYADGDSDAAGGSDPAPDLAGVAGDDPCRDESVETERRERVSAREAETMRDGEWREHGRSRLAKSQLEYRRQYPTAGHDDEAGHGV